MTNTYDEKARGRECEDCGDLIPGGHRRIRCKHCKMLICGWCNNHIHGLVVEHEIIGNVAHPKVVERSTDIKWDLP